MWLRLRGVGDSRCICVHAALEAQDVVAFTRRKRLQTSDICQRLRGEGDYPICLLF